MSPEGDRASSGVRTGAQGTRAPSRGEPEPEPEPPPSGVASTVSGGLIVEVVRLGGDWSAIEPVERLVAGVAAALEAEVDLGEAVVTATLALSSDPHVRDLNRTHRGQDKPTNVLSFPAPAIERAAGEPDFLGDVVVGVETLKREAADEGKTLADHFQHLVLHGLLHLAGYDHENEDDAREMEAVEVAALARLAIADPYQQQPPTEEQTPGNG